METPSSGGTALYDAIRAALVRIRGESGREVIVVVTDGEDYKSRSTAAEVFEDARRSRAILYPIMVMDSSHPLTVDAAAEDFLERLARISGGQFFQPATAKEIPPIYDKILGRLSAQYVLGFTSSNPRHDGTYRKLEVLVKRPGMKVRYRGGYLAGGKGP
jgi:Ca-activated chloride channel family protein